MHNEDKHPLHVHRLTANRALACKLTTTVHQKLSGGQMLCRPVPAEFLFNLTKS